MNKESKQDLREVMSELLEERNATKIQVQQTEQIKQLFIEVKKISSSLEDFIDNKFKDCQDKCREAIHKNEQKIAVIQSQIKTYIGFGAFIGSLIGGFIIWLLNIFIGKG
jgi:uncharacterized protein YoxC